MVNTVVRNPPTTICKLAFQICLHFVSNAPTSNDPINYWRTKSSPALSFQMPFHSDIHRFHVTSQCFIARHFCVRVTAARPVSLWSQQPQLPEEDQRNTPRRFTTSHNMPGIRGDSRMFLMRWHRRGQVPVRGGPWESQVGWHKKGTAQVPGKLISLFINKNHWTGNTCSQLFHCPNRCVCVSSELFVKFAHVLSAADRWLLLWSSLALTCAARFRDNLLAYLPLPGGLALTCTALYCIYLSLTWFLLAHCKQKYKTTGKNNCLVNRKIFVLFYILKLKVSEC